MRRRRPSGGAELGVGGAPAPRDGHGLFRRSALHGLGINLKTAFLSVTDLLEHLKKNKNHQSVAEKTKHMRNKVNTNCRENKSCTERKWSPSTLFGSGMGNIYTDASAVTSDGDGSTKAPRAEKQTSPNLPRELNPHFHDRHSIADLKTKKSSGNSNVLFRKGK